MVFKFIACFLGFAALPAFATDISLYCRVPTTVFTVSTGADGLVTSTVTHPYGIQFTPIYKGTVITEQAATLNAKARELADFGPSQTFTWPAANCRMTKAKVFICTQGTPVMIHGQEVHPISLATTISSHEMADFTYQILNVNVTFRIGPRSYNLTSDYQI